MSEDWRGLARIDVAGFAGVVFLTAFGGTLAAADRSLKTPAAELRSAVSPDLRIRNACAALLAELPSERGSAEMENNLGRTSIERLIRTLDCQNVLAEPPAPDQK